MDITERGGVSFGDRNTYRIVVAIEAIEVRKSVGRG